MKLSRKRLGVFSLVAAVGAFTAATAAFAGPDSGFVTSAPAQLSAAKPGVEIKPLLTVGDTLSDGYVFESIPDGIALTKGHGGVDVYVNHETSTVPFPYDATTGVGFSDFTNALVSKLTLNKRSAAVLSGSYVIPSSANYQRFCSNFLAGKKQGFERDILFTNEEATDFVNRTGTAWPAGPGAEQAGVVVAYDVKSGEYKTIYGMGRLNHENSVAVPGYGEPVVLTGDDTFSAPGSQLYLYNADSAKQVWADEGTLYAFKSDDPAVNDYGDLSGSASVSGTFIPVPESVAKGDQTGLENWSNENGVFQFIRIEDVAYDRNSPNVVYFADTGEPRAIPDPATTRLRRGPSGTKGPYPNGRIFRMELDRHHPTKVRSLSILVDGDSLGAAGAGNVALIHQPDNVETTKGSVFFQEDPGSQNQYAASDPAGTTARTWRYDLKTKELEVVLRVDQSGDPAARQGEWEATGIVDASSEFGPGAFLVNVQAHTLIVNSETRGSLTFKRESGQLLLVRIPEHGSDGNDGHGG